MLKGGPGLGEPLEAIVLLQRSITLLCGGYNTVYFSRSWRRLGQWNGRAGAGDGAGGGNATRGKRIAAAVLALTNLAFLVTSVAPFVAPSYPLEAWQPGAQALAGLFPLAAVGSMTALIWRSRTRG